MKYVFLFMAVCLLAACNNKFSGVPEKYHALLNESFKTAGDNAQELEKALIQAPEAQKEGMAYLISYMPERDLKELKADFLLENTDYAYKAREKYSWAKEIPAELFLNDVLPYVNLNEKREAWRKDFYERFNKYVENCKTLEEAIVAVNKNIRDEVQVDYNTKREKPDQAPFESIRQHMASCSGLSILLADAFRAVGIPARVAGTPCWHDERGNHNWVEVWLNGKWHFTEYYFPGQLDQAWFFADAGQATKNDVNKAIYAASYKPTNVYFPLVWDESIHYVHAFNVTDNYTNLYKEFVAAATNDGNHALLRVMAFKDKKHCTHGDDRVVTNLDVFCGKLQMGGGSTSGPTQDMNDVLTFMLEKNKTYTINYVSKDGMKSMEVELGDKTKEVVLYME